MSQLFALIGFAVLGAASLGLAVAHLDGPLDGPLDGRPPRGMPPPIENDDPGDHDDSREHPPPAPQPFAGVRTRAAFGLSEELLRLARRSRLKR